MIKYATTRAEKTYIKKIVDENTLHRLTTAKLMGLPFKGIDPEKDQRWNYKKINAEMLQAFENGETITQMSERLERVSSMNEAAAIRNARTMTTSFENLGRWDGMQTMKENGTILKKKWLATHDSKTREAHRLLDGQEKEIEELFAISFGESAMYPGDPTADPEMIYNCRCTLTYVVEGFEPSENYDVYVYDKGEENKIHYVDSNASLKEIKTLDGRVIKLNKPLHYGGLDKNIDKKTREEFEKFEYKYLTKGGGVEHEMSKENIKIDQKTGEKIYEITFAKGDSGSVEHTSGIITSHIHPRSREHLGGTFSEADLSSFWSKEKTMRAVAHEGTYSITKLQGFKEKELINAYISYHNRLVRLRDEGKFSKYFNDFAVSMHNWLLRNQKKYGYFYTLEMRGI